MIQIAPEHLFGRASCWTDDEAGAYSRPRCRPSAFSDGVVTSPSNDISG